MRDEDKQAPLHKACLLGHLDVVKFLAEEAKCTIGELIVCVF